MPSFGKEYRVFTGGFQVKPERTCLMQNQGFGSGFPCGIHHRRLQRLAR